MKPVRNTLFFLCCIVAITAHGQASRLTSTQFYDTVFAKKSQHIAYFKLFNVAPNGSVITSDFDMPADKKETSRIMDSLAQDAKHAAALKHATDTIILTVDKRFASVDDGDFQYRVKMDDNVLIDWKRMDFSESNKISGNNYMLVKARQKGHEYVIDIKTAKGKDFAQVISFSYTAADLYNSFMPNTPHIWGIFLPEQSAQLYQATKYGTADSFSCAKLPKVPWEKYGYKGKYDTMSGATFLLMRLLDLHQNKWSGFHNHPYIVPSNLDISDKYNDLIFLMGPITDSQSYEYCVVNDKDTKDTVQKWKKNPAGNAIIELRGMDGGQYRLYVRYDNPDSHSFIYYFTLRIHNVKSFIMGFLVGMSIILLPVFTFKYVRKQKRKNKEMQHKMTALQLQSYRAQLNPHFIFNALNSIQSLVNRDDKELANKYLIEFSTLLRATLDRQSEFWTLHDETDLLQKYIRLEQLRFQFHFEVQIDKNIAAGDIEFPSMLLQPVVENAVKHGIAARQEEGRLNINIAAKADDLVIIIMDNGKGFDPEHVKEDSKGIALTKERMALLNEQNKERTIKLDINSSSQGTTATFYLYHYLHNG